MATSMEADSEVHFKERQEGKGVKTETAVDDATLQFEFRASTPAASPSGRGAEHRGGDAEEPRRIELKKFSLQPEKYDCKVDFEGWVNQFEEYATLGQWTEEEKSSLLFLSLTAGARMYFVGLPEREKMAYATRVEALRRRFGQETDTSIALQELAGLRRGKNQTHRHRPAPDPHGRPARNKATSQALPGCAPRGGTAVGRGHVGNRHHPGKQQCVE